MRRDSTRLTTLLCAVALMAGSVSAEDLVIGSIEVRNENVFNEEEAAGSAPFRIANGLHFTTRESFVRKFLLFSEGDPYQPELLAESERNLRKMPFLKSVSVTAGEAHDGMVDVVVVTQDSWSTEPEISAGSRGGGNKMSFDLKEHNFFGTGRELTMGYAYDPDRTRQRIRLRDPALFGPYWFGLAEYGSSSDGRDHTAVLERPFYSIETPWAFQFSSTYLQQEDRLYRDAEVIDRFMKNEDQAVLELSKALVVREDHAHRLSLGLDWRRKSFDHAEDSFEATLLPLDREYRYVYLRYDFVRNDFVKERYVDRDALVQDFNLGSEWSVELALSPSTFGVDETTGLAALSWSHGFRTGWRSILLTSLSWNSRLGTSDRNQMTSGELRWIHRLATTRFPQTTVASLRVDRGERLDRDFQLYGDGENGLRGYRLHAFAGDERERFNLEHRVFLGREIFKLVSPGVAVFADVGSIVNGGDRSTVSDIGVGLLFSIARSSRGLVRIDAAWALDPDPLGRGGLLISVTSQHPF